MLVMTVYARGPPAMINSNQLRKRSAPNPGSSGEEAAVATSVSEVSHPSVIEAMLPCGGGEVRPAIESPELTRTTGEPTTRCDGRSS